MVHIVSDPRYKIHTKKLKISVDEYLLKKGFSKDYVLNIVFVGTRKMKLIANTYKHEDTALPVLSFPYIKDDILKKTDTEEKLIGEIFICYPQAILLAAEHGKRVDDMLVSLIEHGVQTIIS